MHTHKHFLRELSKFAAGLIAADFIFGIWLFGSGTLPLNALGISWAPMNITAWMIFDILLFLVFIHYGWHADVHAPTLGQKGIFVVVGTITGAIAFAHLVRLMLGLGIEVGGWQAPFWVSWIAVIAAAYISYSSFVFAAGKKSKK